MWFPDNHPSHDIATQFLALKWAELFERGTPNTYRPRLMNVSGLLTELNEVTGYAERYGENHWKRHIRMIVCELKETLEADPIISLDESFWAGFPHEDSLPAPVWRSLSMLAHEELDSYNEKLFDHLNNLLDEDPDLKKKRDAEHILESIATNAVQDGLGRQFCRELVDEDSLGQSPKEFVQHLKDGLTQTKKQWRCVYALFGDESLVQRFLEQSKQKIFPRNEHPSDGSSWRRFSELSKAMHLTCSQRSASDPHNALREGFDELSKTLDVVNFYHNAAPIRLLPKAFANSGREQYLIELDASSISGMQPQHNAMGRALGLLDNLSVRMPREIQQSLERRSAAYAATDIEGKYVQLWSALEALVAVRPEGSVHERVVEGVVKALALGRVDKIVRYTAICLKKFGLLNKMESKPDELTRSSRQKINTVEVFKILSTPDRGNKNKSSILKNHIFPACEDHPLLLNRLYRLFCEFSNAKQMKKGLERSHRHTDWQIHRIYRARNLLIHHGIRTTHLPYLLRNLEYYYASVLSDVLHDLSLSKDWTIMDALEHRRMRYRRAVQALASCNDCPDPQLFFDDTSHQQA